MEVLNFIRFVFKVLIKLNCWYLKVRYFFILREGVREGGGLRDGGKWENVL